jgi:hypothetical protein
MGTKSREVIWGGQVRAAKMNAEHARQRAKEAVHQADRAEAHAWSLRMEGFGGPAQPSPTIAQCLNGGYGWFAGQMPSAARPTLAFRLSTSVGPGRPRHAIWKLRSNVVRAGRRAALRRLA